MRTGRVSKEKTTNGEDETGHGAESASQEPTLRLSRPERACLILYAIATFFLIATGSDQVALFRGDLERLRVMLILPLLLKLVSHVFRDR